MPQEGGSIDRTWKVGALKRCPIAVANISGIVLGLGEEVHDGRWIVLGVDLHTFAGTESADNVVKDRAVTLTGDAIDHIDVDSIRVEVGVHRVPDLHAIRGASRLRLYVEGNQRQSGVLNRQVVNTYQPIGESRVAAKPVAVGRTRVPVHQNASTARRVIGIRFGDRDVRLERVCASLQRNLRIVHCIGVVSENVEGSRLRSI